MSRAGADRRKPSRGRWFFGLCGVAVAWAAQAQPVPYTNLEHDSAVPQVSGTPLGQALQAAKTGDVSRAEVLAAGLSDPIARRLILWAEVDASGTSLSYATLAQARTELAGWPHAARREAMFERALDTSGSSPSAVIDVFGTHAPETASGAMALAAALESQSRLSDAQTLIRSFWREKTFESDDQTRMQARFGRWLTADDNQFRLDALLYQSQGPATRALIPLVDADHQAAAEARIALRSDRSDLYAALSPTMQAEPGVVWEHALYLQRHGLDVQAVQLVRGLSPPPTADAAEATWTPRRRLLNGALKAQDGRGAYDVVASNGLTGGADYLEAQAFLGWLALNKLHDPALADTHFQAVQRMGATPVTLSRAYYWRGRTAEAMGDHAAAQGFYERGGEYTTAFYGQLSAEKAGSRRLRLPVDPTPTPEDRARFQDRDTVQAARLIAGLGDRELLRTFVLSIADALPDAGEYTLLVDFARSTGDQDLAMRAARASGIHGYPLPERGWPVLSVPEGGQRPEAAFSLAIARQESNFDPNARSAFARGLMQLRPETGAVIARKLGLPYSAGRLNDPDYNLALGSAYLGSMVDGFSGSYVMAAAGYNAGPGRPAQWVIDCGDPRQSSSDPADFIECIPFSETRNYVMRVMENTAIYRARLNGGEAPLTAIEDLHRGVWTAASASPPGGPVPYSKLTQTYLDVHAATQTPPSQQP